MKSTISAIQHSELGAQLTVSGKKYISRTKYWNVPVLDNTEAFYCTSTAQFWDIQTV